MNVEFIEQPLPPSDIDGMKQVFEKSALPVIADESCLVESDIKKCFGYFHGINIKLMKCGGLIAAQRMIMEAREYNMEIMVGCMTESSVGVSAIAHLLPLIDYLDMDGPLLIKNDPADGVRYDYGKIILPRRNGLGVILR
jgi:L-alanine-DL-glutamate epimerase-like enolase superfamily enzyme